MVNKDALAYEFKQIDIETNQENKKLILEFQKEFESSSLQNLTKTLESYTSSHCIWHGVYPFEDQQGSEAAVENFGSLSLVLGNTCSVGRIFLLRVNLFLVGIGS